MHLDIQGYVIVDSNQLLHWHMRSPENKTNVIDHINGNKLDNRRKNLRSVSCSWNTANTEFTGGNTGIRGLSRLQDGTYMGEFFNSKLNPPRLVKKQSKDKEEIVKWLCSLGVASQ